MALTHYVSIGTFLYEEPDPSVGLHGGWEHEDCPAGGGDDSIDVDRYLDDRPTLTCRACGGTTDPTAPGGPQALTDVTVAVIAQRIRDGIPR